MGSFIVALEAIGAIAFAVSGAIEAVKKNMDLFGVVILGIVTAVGGGVMRDITIGNLPPAAFREPVYALIAAVSSVIVFAAVSYSRKREGRAYAFPEKLLFIADSLGLAIFTVLGMEISVRMGQSGKAVLIFVGVITGVGGGVIRDVLAGNIPFIFRKHIYATASLAGAVLYIFVYDAMKYEYAMLLCIAVVMVIRCLSATFKWNLPSPKNNISEKNK